MVKQTKFSQSRVKRGGQEAELNFKDEESFAAEVINDCEDSAQLPNESTVSIPFSSKNKGLRFLFQFFW